MTTIYARRAEQESEFVMIASDDRPAAAVIEDAAIARRVNGEMGRSIIEVADERDTLHRYSDE